MTEDPFTPLVLSTWDSGEIANAAAWRVLASGGKALDAVEQGGIAIEEAISCCVGLGGYPDRDGYVTLDACIMDHEANCGSVAFLQRIRHPVSLARLIMETTPHVMLAGEGALRFALSNGFPLEGAELSADAAEAYGQWLKRSDYRPQINIERSPTPDRGPSPPGRLEGGKFNHDTMGTLALDQAGNVSGMCTTSGLAFKMHGRVGDSPIIGAGLFVDNAVGAAVATGTGEEIIRVSGCHAVVEGMRQGLSPQQACERVIERIVKRDPVRARHFQAAFIAIGRSGTYGAFAVQPGFNFCITHEHSSHAVHDASSYL